MFYHSIRVIVQRYMKRQQSFCSRVFHGNINEDDLCQSEIHKILQIHNINEHSNHCERDTKTQNWFQPARRIHLEKNIFKAQAHRKLPNREIFDVIKNDL